MITEKKGKIKISHVNERGLLSLWDLMTMILDTHDAVFLAAPWPTGHVGTVRFSVRDSRCSRAQFVFYSVYLHYLYMVLRIRIEIPVPGRLKIKIPVPVPALWLLARFIALDLMAGSFTFAHSPQWRRSAAGDGQPSSPAPSSPLECLILGMIYSTVHIYL
jgi:hypothetical protein